MNAETNKMEGAGNAPRVLFAGGGTGGHLFPAVAIAEALLERNARTRLLFVGSGRPMEQKIIPASGFASETITIEGIVGRGRWRQIVAAFKIPRAIWQSIGIIRRFKPDIAIGMGGYSAGPVLAAARLMGKHVVIHEQNALPGVTNRMLARLAHKIFVSFEETRKHFNPDKVIFSGNPVRRMFSQSTTDKSSGTDGHKPRPFTVFIMGGSQGAHGINRIVAEALPLLGKQRPLFFIHQTGETDEAMMKVAYEENKVAGDIRAFFPNIHRQYTQADLVICRAGATTVAEVAATAKPAILIPFPFHTDNHQVVNASGLVKAGGAEMVMENTLEPAILAGKIDEYAGAPERLKKMSDSLKQIGAADAAETIVDGCYRLISSGGAEIPDTKK